MCVVLQEAIERGRKEGTKIGVERGRREGISKGETQFAQLVTFLLQSGRNDDIPKIAEDETYRQKLYRQFKIIKKINIR